MSLLGQLQCNHNPRNLENLREHKDIFWSINEFWIFHRFLLFIIFSSKWFYAGKWNFLKIQLFKKFKKTTHTGCFTLHDENLEGSIYIFQSAKKHVMCYKINFLGSCRFRVIAEKHKISTHFELSWENAQGAGAEDFIYILFGLPPTNSRYETFCMNFLFFNP